MTTPRDSVKAADPANPAWYVEAADMLSFLLDGRFDEYLRAARSAEGLWLFVHVPKTAGSSLSSELAAHAAPYYNIHIDHADQSRPVRDRFNDAVSAFLDKARTGPFRSAGGHVWQEHVQTITKELAGVRLITLLREPLSRLVSDYHYQRSPMHPLHQQVIARTPDFMSFAEQRGPRNRMARHLVPMAMIRQERIEEAVEYVRRSFYFIGLQEQYALYFKLLTLMTTGVCKAPGDKKRVNDAKDQISLTEDQVLRVRQLNRLDFAIYEAVSSWLGNIELRLSAWLDAVGSQVRVDVD